MCNSKYIRNRSNTVGLKWDKDKVSFYINRRLVYVITDSKALKSLNLNPYMFVNISCEPIPNGKTKTNKYNPYELSEFAFYSKMPESEAIID